MTDLTRADFLEWANHPMTAKVRNAVLEERASMDSISGSLMLERAANKYADGLTALEALGLESAMRASAITGLEYFTDFENLSHVLFGEVDSDEG